MAYSEDLEKIELYIVIKDGTNYYYIMKVEHRGSETFCFLPNAGFHFTEHESGEAHFRAERNKTKPAKGVPVAMTTGEAGVPFGEGFSHATPEDLGAAYSITTLCVPLDTLNTDFRKYHRSLEKCFVINKDLFPKDTNAVFIGLWYVPTRNITSFEWNNRNIHPDLLYKVEQCEPQIWAFAQSLDQI